MYIYLCISVLTLYYTDSRLFESPPHFSYLEKNTVDRIAQRTVLDSTTSPLMGAYTSLAAFTDSTDPKGSLLRAREYEGMHGEAISNSLK